MGRRLPAGGSSFDPKRADHGPNRPTEPQSWPSTTTDAAKAAGLGAEFEQDRPARTLTGWPGRVVSVVAVGVGLLVVWQVFAPLRQGSQFYLMVFLTAVLPLVFLTYPSGIHPPGRGPSRRSALPARIPAASPTGHVTPADWCLAVLAVAVCAYPVLPFVRGGYNGFLDRQGLLDPVDVLAGTALLVLILEACRRTTGPVLPVVCVLFLGYAYYGGALPADWAIAHAGLNWDQIVDALYNSPSGFYGTPLDVAATYVVLFTLYAAVLDRTGASAFFVDLSLSAFRRSRSAPGRTAVAAGFLLGTVSGSGAATTLSVGSVTWPILRRAGYPPAPAGGLLAAAGVGAILSPPTLGAAGFLIAELLGVPYLQVLVWATAPMLLYYLGILLAVETDARRFGIRTQQDLQERTAATTGRLLRRYGYHLLSLVLIAVFLLAGQSAARAVVYATALAAVLSVLDPRHRLTPRRAIAALDAGVRGALPVVAICAAAGVLTAVTTKTGLGPQAASLIVSGARALTTDPALVAALTAVVAAAGLCLLGLAVPVTASFIIGWVIIGPALLDLGVGPAAAALFVFYFAVLSETTPPTALAAAAAAAVTGARVLPTMWQTLRYALPAYLVPMAFVLTPTGAGLLGMGGAATVVYAGVTTALSVAVLSVAAGGWLLGVGPAGRPERTLAGCAGIVLLWLTPTVTLLGVALSATVVVAVLIRRRTARPAPAEQSPLR